MIPENADYLVRAYDRSNKLLLETWHIGEASKDDEVDAWKTRYERGDVSRVVVVGKFSGKETYPPWPSSVRSA